MSNFGKGIPLASGFDLGAKVPLDSRIAVQNIQERDAHVTNNRAYEGLRVYVIDESCEYLWNGNEWLLIPSKQYVDDAIANVEISDEQLENYATKDEIPTKTSQLENDSNFAIQPNFTFNINMIASTDQPSVTTSGMYPNLVITFNIPQGITSGGGQTTEEAIYYGRLSINEIGESVVQYNSITPTMIKNGTNITKTTPQILGKTSMGKQSTTSKGDYIIVLVPKNKGYVATKDNGLGGKVIFNKEVAGANGETIINIDGNEYLIYGEILISPAEMFIYIDKN